jgi:ABC-type transport system involved in multi-copper enzyme maturation permease subunit
MNERAVHVRVITWSTLVETVRRKDLYVVWMLALFGLVGGSVIGLSAQVRGLETFVRDIVLTVINLLSTVICIWLAARQVPEELSRRTLFPLLARPVRRFDVLLGKFLAVWALSVFALLVLAAAAWVNLLVMKATIGPIFWQYLYLRALSFGPIAAMTMAISLVFSPAATVIFSGLLTLCATTFARSLYGIIEGSTPALQVVYKPVYFLLPHLDLFDLSQRTAYNYPPIAAWALGAMLLYAAAYVAVFLSLGDLRFRRMAV